MADYFPLLVRAISSLPQKTGENRRAVYDRARATLVRQLRSVDPPLPEGEITRERLSLEEAIRRVETEFASQDNSREAPAARDAAPPARDAGAGRDAGPARAEPGPPARLTAGAGAPGAGSAPATRLPVDPRRAPPRTEPDAEPADADEADAAPAEAAPAESRRDARARTEDARARTEDEPAGTDQRPSVRRGEVKSRGAASGARRNMRAAERGGSWQKIILWMLVAGVVLGGVALAVANRQLILGGLLGGEGPASSPTDQPKSADRVATTSGGDGARRAGATRATPGGTQRALLLEETPGGGQPQTFEGTVSWKTETVSAGPGLPPDIGVRGEITIPERQIAMQFVLRRNTDQTLPASHTIEISFTLPADFPFGGVANVPLIVAKPNPQARGNPLAGLSVKVSATLFLVGLSQTPADKQRNIALLQLSPWLDVPVVFTNNKRALISFEKGPAGDQAFADAFSAWGELIQQPTAEQQQQLQQQQAPQPGGG